MGTDVVQDSYCPAAAKGLRVEAVENVVCYNHHRLDWLDVLRFGERSCPCLDYDYDYGSDFDSVLDIFLDPGSVF